jgi:hypothetical protein
VPLRRFGRCGRILNGECDALPVGGELQVRQFAEIDCLVDRKPVRPVQADKRHENSAKESHGEILSRGARQHAGRRVRPAESLRAV